MMQIYAARQFMAQPIFLPLYELETFPVVVASERGTEFFTEEWCSIIWTALHRDQISFCKCFDLPGYNSDYRICEF